MQDNQDKDTNTDELKSTREYKNKGIPPGAWMFVSCILQAKTIKTKNKYGKSTKREKGDFRGGGGKPGEGKFFRSRSRPALEPTQPPVQWVPGSFPRVNHRG
jgi:hypothetical protein